MKYSRRESPVARRRILVVYEVAIRTGIVAALSAGTYLLEEHGSAEGVARRQQGHPGGGDAGAQRGTAAAGLGAPGPVVGTPPGGGGIAFSYQQVVLNPMMNGIDAMHTITDRPRELSISSCGQGVGEVLVSLPTPAP